jgi:hypothetical protein
MHGGELMASGGIEFTREDLTDLATIKTSLAGVNDKLDLIIGNQDKSNQRIDALEAYRENCIGQEEGMTRAASRTAGIVAFVVSTILGIVAIAVAIWRS